MKVCLTGATGFVGSHTAAALAAAGHDLRLLVRDADRARSVLAGRGVPRDRYELVVGDMCDAGPVAEATAGCAATVHTAAAIAVTGRGDDVATFETNTIGAARVVDAAIAAGHDPVVNVSTIGVFVPPRDPVITTESPLAAPRSAYARSKVAIERRLRSLQDGGAPVSIVYPGGVLGPDQPSLDATIEGIVGARTGGWPRTTGGVNLVDVRDVAAVLTAALTPGAGARRFMLGGTFLDWAGLGALTDEICGVRARRVPLPGPVIITVATALDLLRRLRPVDYPLTRDAAEFMTRMVPTDDTPTLDALGITLRPVRRSLEDTLRWVVAGGHLDPRHAPRLAPTDAV